MKSIFPVICGKAIFDYASIRGRAFFFSGFGGAAFAGGGVGSGTFSTLTSSYLGGGGGAAFDLDL